MTPQNAKLTLSEPVAAVALLLLGIACAGFVFAQPHAVPPLEAPSISLPALEVERVMQKDKADARTAPVTPHARELSALLLAQGEAESRGNEDIDSYSNRRKALKLGFRSFTREVGEANALKLRSQAVEQLEAALELRMPVARGKLVLGAFSNVLARDGLSRDGELYAPRFVIRTLFKARWNLLFGMPPEYAFERVERRAFFGWQALHAESVALPRRVEALREYGAAGGDQLDEALGVLLYRAGDYAGAVNALERAYRKQGGLRLRNYSLAARAAASAAPE